MSEIVLKGVAAAPGIVFGNAFILDKQEFVVSPRAVLDNEVPSEQAKFEEAVTLAKTEIINLKNKLGAEHTGHESKIFDAHLLILEDQSFVQDVLKRIEKEKLCVEYVFTEVVSGYLKKFAMLKDEYLRERASDINDISRRVLKHLVGEYKLHELENVKEKLIIIGHDLSPSDTASMYNKNIIGFVTDIGGKTSHTAIMAKSLGVPAVVGLKDVTLKANNQDYLIVDGQRGLVIVNPEKETLAQYKSKQLKIAKSKSSFDQIKNLPGETKDGRKVGVYANLELPEEIPSVIAAGADGIGLYRTEFFYMNRVDLPAEEEQFQAYKKVVQKMKGKPVTIRTLDIGGDKFLSVPHMPIDMKPALGWRGIQFCLQQPELFKTQLRALLRASKYGPLRIMYPMISGVHELRQANLLLEEAQKELEDMRKPYDSDVDVGIMIEVPAAVIVADLLAKEVDFFSIGTNDLIQYSLAIDRVNEHTAELYEPANPAILRMIKSTVDAGHKEGIKVSLCGEMSGELHLAFLLLGLELDELSMSAVNIPQIKSMIRNVEYKKAKKIAHTVLNMSTQAEIESVVLNRLKEMIPEQFNYDT